MSDITVLVVTHRMDQLPNGFLGQLYILRTRYINTYWCATTNKKRKAQTGRLNNPESTALSFGTSNYLVYNSKELESDTFFAVVYNT